MASIPIQAMEVPSSHVVLLVLALVTPSSLALDACPDQTGATRGLECLCGTGAMHTHARNEISVGWMGV